MVKASGAGPGLARLRLFQLISPALPVGSFAYSQGLEYAVQAGWVGDREAARQWIGGLLEHALVRLDVPVMCRLYEAWQKDDPGEVLRWSRYLIACRETQELRAEERHLGTALARLLSELGIVEAAPWRGSGRSATPASFATLYALACLRWGIPVEEAAYGYVWFWLEGQVTAAVKLVPLGQTDGQRMLATLAWAVPGLVAGALALEDRDIGASVPGQTLASILHETQYSRLFRS